MNYIPNKQVFEVKFRTKDLLRTWGKGNLDNAWDDILDRVLLEMKQNGLPYEFEIKQDYSHENPHYHFEVLQIVTDGKRYNHLKISGSLNDFKLKFWVS